jgi:serine/threonine protein kinase
MDLLKKMMASDPLERISAEEALKHPFFDNLKKFDAQAISPSLFKQTQEELDYMQKVKANLLEYNSLYNF